MSAPWQLDIRQNNFNTEEYVPLDGVFLDPVHVKLDITVNYYTSIYGIDVEDNVYMEFDLTGYTPHITSTEYPCIAVALNEENDPYYPSSAGVSIYGKCPDASYTFENFTGTHTDINGVVTQLSDPNWGGFINGAVTTGGHIRINECNIPVVVCSADTDDYGDNLWFYRNDINPDLCISDYLPNSDPITNEVLQSAVNWDNNQSSLGTEKYYIYNSFEEANVSMGIVNYTGAAPTGRYEIFKTNAKPVLYYVDKDHSFELRLLYSEIVGSCYSSISVQDVKSKEYTASEWYMQELKYTGPWYKQYSHMPDGHYTIGVLFDTNIPIFSNRRKAEQYLDGEIPEEDAENYSEIGKPQIATNETGQKETATTFGGNESENVFSHDYMMTRSQLATIGGKFFDTSVWTALLEGLKIYGNNPMESVLSCFYFPFDLSTIATDATAVSDIYFGSYKMQSVSANKIKHRSGYKEMGSTFIKPTFYNWLDYKAQHVYLYLPYCGFVELDINKYLNKWLKVIYMVDLHSGECEISLLADNLLMDTYSGQIGIKQPITYNDLSSYFQAQVTALRNGAAALIGGPIAGAGTGAQLGGMGGPYGAIAGAAAGAAVGQSVGKATALWTGYKVASTKPPLFSKGGYSSEVGANMPQYCFLVFMYNDVVIPENELMLFGKPSEKSGNIGNFSGFLSVNYVKLQVPTATETEKNEILSLLNSGIYI